MKISYNQITEDLNTLFELYKKSENNHVCKKLDRNHMINTLMCLIADRIIDWNDDYTENIQLIKYVKYEVILFYDENKFDLYDIKMVTNFMNNPTDIITVEVHNDEFDIIFDFTFQINNETNTYTIVI